MIDQAAYERVVQALPLLRHADAALARELRQAAFLARVPVGRDVFVEGDRVDAIALLLSGVVRVYKSGETGREITLYRFGLGESCVLTANAILSQGSFPAIATVEQDVEAVMIPAERFRAWVRQDDLWREFVFELFSQRLAAVMAIVDEVVFGRMDRRLATLLHGRARSVNPVRVTHQEMADELGSAREVVSRLIEELAAAGVVSAGRGVVEVLDFDGLSARARM